jgi:glycerol-3-phosphate dehydrogenase
VNLREKNIVRLKQEDFDVLVVGAGINGAVSAAALSSRGLKVALVDRGDFASETSQESSNLVWGGIKYLETFEFSLVHKLCAARNKLLSHYPSSVKEIRFLAALEKGFRFHPLLLYLATLVYWVMGNFFTRAPRYHSRKTLLNTESKLDPTSCIGGVEYSDAYLHDNDSRFVFNFVRQAMDNDCATANYVTCVSSKYSEDFWHTSLLDLEDQSAWTIRSKVLINACGPFADQYNTQSSTRTEHKHIFSKGVHLVVDQIIPEQRVLAFFADDGRLFFAIPMGPKTCIGTTDTRIDTLPATITDEDRHFILENINKRLRLPQPLRLDDIISERCGVRPLVVGRDLNDKDKGDWASLSRKHVLESNPSQSHITIFGGKLTDCINIGEEVCDLVESFGMTFPNEQNIWYGEPSQEDKEKFVTRAQEMDLDAHTAPHASEKLSSRLWRRYGHHSFSMLDEIVEDPSLTEILIQGTEYIRVELHHAAQHEMVTHLEDFLRRRSKIALVAPARCIDESPGLREACTILFNDQASTRLKNHFDSESIG